MIIGIKKKILYLHHDRLLEPQKNLNYRLSQLLYSRPRDTLNEEKFTYTELPAVNICL